MIDLDNDEEWNGEPLELLDDNHRQNVIAWLGRNAEQLQYAEGMAFVGGAMPSPDSVAFTMVMSGIHEELGQGPREWLEEQPLMVRLRELESEAEV